MRWRGRHRLTRKDDGFLKCVHVICVRRFALPNASILKQENILTYPSKNTRFDLILMNPMCFLRTLRRGMPQRSDQDGHRRGGHGVFFKKDI